MNTDIHSFAVITSIILLTGFLGGLRNWIWNDVPTESDTHGNRYNFFGRVIDATIASAAIPLFLSVIGNGKILPAFEGADFSDADYIQAVFILASFCGLAAIFSDRFLDGLSKKVMILHDKVDDVEQKVDQATLVTDVQVEPEMGGRNSEESARGKTVVSDLAKNAQSTLKALATGQFLMRSKTGLAESTSLSVGEVSSALRDLEEKALVRQLRTGKGQRWALTDSGRIAASEL